VNFECDTLENISYEIHINNTKWLIMGIYKPPSVNDADFSETFSKHIKVHFSTRWNAR
jgi:hypothetical protein